MIPAAISQVQAPPFSTETEVDGQIISNTSMHPCHRLSIPAARLFWCRHCMQIFEDPITRWRHSKTCLQSSSGKVKKDKDGSTMQVFLTANNLSELRREQNKSRAISRSVGPGQSPGTDLRCFICKTAFVSIDEMRAHVRTPCRKRTTIAVPKHKFSALPAETSIQIPNTASEIIYIKDGHQTVISLENPYTEEVLNTEFIEHNQEYEMDNISATEEIVILPDTFDSTTNLNTIEQTVEISAVETVLPVASKSEEVMKQPKNWNENKENNIQKRKRILFPKEVDDWPNCKTSNSPKSDPQITLSSPPPKSDDPKDILNDFEVPPIKISKMTNIDPEDETNQIKFRAKPLQTKEEFSQLLTADKKGLQLFPEEEHVSNGVITELITDEIVLFDDPDSPAEKIVTGAAAEARLKDLFSTIDIQNKAKLSSPVKQAKSVSISPKSPCKTSSPPKIRKDDIKICQNDDREKDERRLSLSKDEEVDTSGFLLYMPPINAGSVTLHDPLLDLRSGLPAEMLLDETTNTKPPTIPTAPEAINHFYPSDIIEETKLPSHIFDGDLLPSHIHSEVLFEEIMEEKGNSSSDDNGLAEGLITGEINFEEAVNIESPVGVDKVEEEIEKITPVVEELSAEEVVEPSPRHSETNKQILKESELDQVNNEESSLPVAKSLEMSIQAEEPIPEEKNSERKSEEEGDEEEEEGGVTEKNETKTKDKSVKLFKCKACSNTFKTSQALQKHSRVPCKVKHTRSLSQKILRPKQPCIKIEKKPIKKKMVKPQRRPKFMVPIIPITRSELIRPTVPRRPKRFSRRKRKKSFFIDEQNRILPFVNVLMSELSDKDRFFYKLGMINQYRKTPASSEMTTVPNGETPAVETLGDSLEQSSSKVEFPDVNTDPTYLSEIASLSSANVTAAESQGIAFSASPAVAASGCISDREKPSAALAKGLCLSLPTLEKMEDDQFHDPTRDPSGGVTSPSPVQSPCWEAAPRLAQLPGVTQIVRVTSADPLNEINSADKLSVTPESDQSKILANSKSLSLSNSSPHSKIMSKETVNDSNLNISDCHLVAKTLALKCEKNKVLDLKESCETVFEDRTSLPKKVLASLQEECIKEQSCSDVAQMDNTNLTDKKMDCKSDSKTKILKIKDRTNVESECKKPLKKAKIVSLDDTDQSQNKNLTKSKDKHSCTAKHDVIKPVNQCKNSSRTKDRNEKGTDSCNGANIEKGTKKSQSVDSDISNSQKRISSSLSKNLTTLSSKKVTPDRKPSSKKVASNWEDPSATTNLCKKLASNQEATIAKNTLCKKVASNQLATIAKNTLCKKIASNEETPLATPYKKVVSNQETITIPYKKVVSNQEATTTSYKKVVSNQEATTTPYKKVVSNQEAITTPYKKVVSNQEATTTFGKKVVSNQDPPMATTTSCKKIVSSKETSSIPMTSISKKLASNQESSIATTPLSKKVASNQESSIATTPLSKKITSNQESSIPTTSFSKKVASNQESSIATTSLSKKVASNQESPIATTSFSKKVVSNQESPIATTSFSKKVASNQESSIATTPLSKKVASNQESSIATTSLSKKVVSNQESPIATTTLSKKVASNQESSIATTSLSKTLASNQESSIATTFLSKKVASNQESLMATTPLSKKVASNQESSIATTSLSKKVASNQESSISTTTLSKKASNQESSIATTTLSKMLASNQESSIATTSLSKKIASNQESSIPTTCLSKKVASNQESLMAATTFCQKVGSNKELSVATTSLCKKSSSCTNSDFSLSSKKTPSQDLNMELKSKSSSLIKENKNMVLPKNENCPKSLLSNDRTSPTLSTVTSLSKAVHNPDSVSVAEQRTSCERKSLTPHKDHNQENIVNKKNNLEPQLPKGEVAEPIWKSLQVDVSEESLKMSDTYNEQERHFSDIFGHEKDSLGAEDSSNRNYLISPSKERSKRHFLDFLCGFSESAAASRSESAENRLSGLSQGKINNNIEEPRISKYLKTDESPSWNQEKKDSGNITSLCRSSEDSKESSGISCNLSQVAELPAVHYVVNKNQEFGNKLIISTKESPANSTLKNYKLKEDVKPSSITGECRSERTLASSECHSERTLALEECRSERTLASGKYHSERTSASGECHSERTLALKECHFERTLESGECRTERTLALSEWHCERTLASGEWHSERTFASEECQSERTLASGECRSERTLASGECRSEKTLASGVCRSEKTLASGVCRSEKTLASGVCRSEKTLASGECRSEKTLASGVCRSEKTLASGECRTERTLASGECRSKKTLVLGECRPEEPVTELLSEKSLQNFGSCDPYKADATAVATVTTTAVTLTSSHSSNNGCVTNSTPVESKTPVKNSKTSFNSSSVATLNPRVSIATQTDSSFLKETKTEQNVPAGSCDNVENKEAAPPSDPPHSLTPSSPATNTTPTPILIDDIPSPIVLSEEERSEEIAQENIHLDPSTLPPEIVINDTHLSSISPSLGTTSELVQGIGELQEDTEASIVQQESVWIPSTVDDSNPSSSHHLVLDNLTDPNVLVQYLSSLDPSLLSQDVTYVIIQGTPDEPVPLTDDHNFIIEQTANSDHAEQESANSPLIFTMQPQLDITTEAEVIITDS